MTPKDPKTVSLGKQAAVATKSLSASIADQKRLPDTEEWENAQIELEVFTRTFGGLKDVVRKSNAREVNAAKKHRQELAIRNKEIESLKSQLEKSQEKSRAYQSKLESVEISLQKALTGQELAEKELKHMQSVCDQCIKTLSGGKGVTGNESQVYEADTLKKGELRHETANS